MRLPRILTGLLVFALLNSCISDNNGSSGLEQTKPVAEDVIYESINPQKIKDFKATLEENFILQLDTIPHHSLKEAEFSFFEGFIAMDKKQQNKLRFQFFKFNTVPLCEKANARFLAGLGDLSNVKPGKKMKYIKNAPIFSIKNEDSIILLKHSCENNMKPQKLEDLKQALQKHFSTEKSTVLNVECGGPLNWL